MGLIPDRNLYLIANDPNGVFLDRHDDRERFGLSRQDVEYTPVEGVLDQVAVYRAISHGRFLEVTGFIDPAPRSQVECACCCAASATIAVATDEFANVSGLYG